MARLLRRRRDSLGWRLRHENPRRLSKADYVAALDAQRAALTEAKRAATPIPIADLVRRAAPPPAPALTRDQQAAMLHREAMAEVLRRG